MLSIRSSDPSARRALLARWAARVSAVPLLGLIAALLLLPFTAGRAEAAALTSLSWTVSNTQTGATGVSYAFSARVATQNTVGIVTMTVPAGTAGTPAVARNYGVPAGTVGLAGNVLTYTVTTPIQLRPGLPIYLEISGLTNTGTAGSSTSAITTKTAAAVIIDGPTSTNSVSFGSGATSTIVAVAKSTVFSSDTSGFNLILDPGVNTSATQVVNLGVSSNAASGYTLSCKVDQQPTGASGALTAYNAGMASAAAWASGGAGSFGYSMGVTNNGTLGSPAAGGTLSTTNFAGFSTTAENCAAATGRTGNPLASDLSSCGVGLCASAAHAWQSTIKAAADFTTPADVYSATITYTVTPTY